MSKAKAPESHRNGLSWRDGRPRWVPSPASRNLGVKGRDLKHPNGEWVNDRGLAISLADSRAFIAKVIRNATRPGAAGDAARTALTALTGDLPAPTTPDEKLRRANIEDLISLARQLFGNLPPVPKVISGPTVGELVRAYFLVPIQSPEQRERGVGTIIDPATMQVSEVPWHRDAGIPHAVTLSTLKFYATQSKKLVKKYGHNGTETLTQDEAYNWYHTELVDDFALTTANAVVGTGAAIFRWGTRAKNPQGQLWTRAQPFSRLDTAKPKGRLVFWPGAIEAAFVAFCDEMGAHDVADAVIMGNYTGARQIDMVIPSIEQLSGRSWRYTPTKTARRSKGEGHLEALPGIMPQLAERIEMRMERLRQSGVTYLNPGAEPFLWNIVENKPHTSLSIGDRFIDLKKMAMRRVAWGERPELAGIENLRLQDTRDTCVTRLFVAAMMDKTDRFDRTIYERISAWTGHSLKSIETIVRFHYLTLREEGAVETAKQYEAWALAAGQAL